MAYREGQGAGTTSLKGPGATGRDERLDGPCPEFHIAKPPRPAHHRDYIRWHLSLSPVHFGLTWAYEVGKERWTLSSPQRWSDSAAHGEFKTSAGV